MSAIDSVQLYTSTGLGFRRDGDVAHRPSMGAGVSFTLLEDRLAIPVNIHADRLRLGTGGIGGGIWGLGGDLSGRIYLGKAKYLGTMSLDLGLKVDNLIGEGQAAVGLTPFGRIGFHRDKVNLEGGVLAYSGREDMKAGRGFIMINVNALALGQAILREPR